MKLLLLAMLASTFAFGHSLGKQFDLICEGNQRERIPPIWREGSFQTTFHVDLSDGSFCFDYCDNVYKLTRWDAHELYYAFSAEKTHGFRESDTDTLVAEFDRFKVTLPGMTFRRDYKYTTCTICTAASPHWEKSSGTCRKAPFTGFARRPDAD